MSDDARLKRRRLKLWIQDSRCRFCRVHTMLPEHVHAGLASKEVMATIEHLDSRYNPLRGTYRNQERTTLACWKCNNDRNRKEQASVDIEVLHRRSSHV